MKKIIIILILVFLQNIGFNTVSFAEVKRKVITYTSEKCLLTKGGQNIGGSGQMERYKCEVDADSYKDFISEVYKLIFFISLIVSVLLIVTYGILLTLSGVIPLAEEYRTAIKGRITDILIGVL